MISELEIRLVVYGAILIKLWQILWLDRKRNNRKI